MMDYYPKNYFITSGTGKSIFKLVAFDEALRNAKISDYNLVKISSILPSDCIRATPNDFPAKGSSLLTAFGSISCNEKGKQIASAVSVAIPKDPNDVGVIMEYAGYCSAQYAEEQVRLMVEEAMKNRERDVKSIYSSAIDSICDGNGYTSVVSAVCLW